MKKRIISTLLAVCLVAALFSGMTITAHADEVETVKHTLKSGETVYGVCKELGIDFYANYNWITSTNKITNYSSLKPGTVITLPLSDTAGLGSSITGGNTAGNTNTGSGNVSGSLLAGDYVSGYLIPHTMQYGETVYDICVSMGIDFNKNSDIIMKINELKNYNRIAVGRTILFPSSNPPASGSCIKIVAHKIVAGDATYNICKSYNIDYNDNLKLLQILNKKENLSAIKYGQILYVPVPATVVPNSGGNGSGGNSGTTAPSTTPTAPPVYTITADTVNTNAGSYTVSVDGKAATSATAGKSVSVNVTVKSGYKLDSIKVVNLANQQAVTVSKGSFTMPAGNVRITVKIVSATEYDVKKSDVTNGSFSVNVNGNAVKKASQGQTVDIVPAPAYGYELDKITVTDVNSAPVTVTNGSFTMPASAVRVTVTFRAAKEYKLPTATNDGHGTAELQYNGNKVDGKTVGSGEIVKVVTKANEGYTLKDIVVTDKEGNKLTVTNSSFVMPNCDVSSVAVSFKGDEYTATLASVTNGTATLDKTSVGWGVPVTITYKANEGYTLDKITVTKDSKEVSPVTINNNTIATFNMPSSDCQVNVTFRKGNYGISNDTVWDGKVSYEVNGKAVTSANMGDTVTVKVEPNEGYKVKSITAAYGSAKDKELTVTNGSFTMPASGVKVTVTLEKIEYKLSAESAKGTVTFEVGGKTVTTATVGDTVTARVSPNSGAVATAISAASGGKDISINGGTGVFTMPAGDVKVTVTYK